MTPKENMSIIPIYRDNYDLLILSFFNEVCYVPMWLIRVIDYYD